MKVEATSLDQVRKKVEVILPEEKIKDLENEIYDELKKQAKIKGFRPGKTPRSIIAAYYKDYIADELNKRMVQATMTEALTTANVKPLTEPFVDFMEKEGEHGYTLECEVEPEFELPEYKGIAVEVAKLSVTDQEIDARIDGLRNMHATMHMKEGDSGAAKGDFVIVKYQGYLDGQPVKDIATEGYPLEIGSTTLIPEFEEALIGMKAGEEKDVPVNFKDDYPDASIAGQTIIFHVTVKEIREKKLPELNDEFAKDLSFESMEVMREGMVKEIEKEKETARKRDITQQIVKALAAGVDIPIPARFLEKRTAAMVEEAKSRFQGQKLGEEEERALNENLKKEFGPRTEDRIKVEMILAKIAEKEGIKVTEDEVFDRIKKFSEDAKRPFTEVLGFYQQYNLMGGLRQSLIEEKAVDFLQDYAKVKEKE